MSPKARALIGVVTAFFFAVSGALLIAEDNDALGWVLVGLAILRGLMAAQQVRALRADPDDEDDDA